MCDVFGARRGGIETQLAAHFTGDDSRGVAGEMESLRAGRRSLEGDIAPASADENAYQWLAEQDRRPVLQAWGFIAAVCGFWLLGWCAWPQLWPRPLSFYTTATVLLLGLDLLISYSAARRITADRRDGALELSC
jgi:hypothetical protein